MEANTNREGNMTADQLNTLADVRESYGDTREALELRQKAKKAAAAEQAARDAEAA